MDILIVAVLAAAVGAGIGWWLGARSGQDRVGEVLRSLAADLDAGRRPSAGAEAPDGMAEVRQALERNWSGRNEEREKALREALGRIAAFLREEVRRPLAEALAQDEPPRPSVEHAFGALQDLEFYLREPLTPDETHNLTPVVQQVTREFTQDWEVGVRLRISDQPVRAHIHRDTFMDAVYLLLHNAAQFAGPQTIDVTVDKEGDRSVVVVRDRGPGFTPEALERAHDLFFTTSETALGLGIPFARKIVESFGGSVAIRNVPEGGAEVKLLLPSA